MNELEKLNISSLPVTNDFIKDIKVIINVARKQTYKSINSIMVQAYWLIWRRIVIQEQNGENELNMEQNL